ncbi:DMT family transporter [Thermithiobacillus plumbiphilus]|uniref:DMT family transporter n=1 Tax=Thermithiobacillus plumbiphilus TaxID=1729899 RepID=A0ABU9DB41_9PROT
MPVALAYFGVILIWSTTPLALQWSIAGGGFLFGVSSRMLLGGLLALALLRALGKSLSFEPAARRTYLAAGLGIYASMICTYWAAQYIPSGWISVIFGLMPMATGLFAAIWLPGRAFSPARVLGMLMGLVGLLVIFGRGVQHHPQAVYGILAVLLGTLSHAASAVWIKRISAGLDGLNVTVGGLGLAAPLFLLSWLLLDGELPRHLPLQAGVAIGYLALIGSVLGFMLYYQVLRQLEASRVALITLVTPVSALWLGHVFNQEPLGVDVWTGTALILAGLVLHELGEPLLRALRYRHGGWANRL